MLAVLEVCFSPKKGFAVLGRFMVVLILFLGKKESFFGFYLGLVNILG